MQGLVDNILTLSDLIFQTHELNTVHLASGDAWKLFDL
jgi:hypothetical protein